MREKRELVHQLEQLAHQLGQLVHQVESRQERAVAADDGDESLEEKNYRIL